MEAKSPSEIELPSEGTTKLSSIEELPYYSKIVSLFKTYKQRLSPMTNIQVNEFVYHVARAHRIQPTMVQAIITDYFGTFN